MISPDDFLAQAEAWVQMSDEASWRSAVSRGYYAAFHAARRLLGDLGFQVPGVKQVHAYLPLRLINSGHPAIIAAGSDLKELLKRRGQADYEIQSHLSQGAARAFVALARSILSQLALAHADPVRSQVIAAVRAYETNVLRQPTYQGP